jgi:glucose-1-phosphate cytidylyltransferase
MLRIEALCFNFGGGVSNVNIADLVKFHKSNGRKTALNAVYPSGRFEAIDIHADSQVASFKEKSKSDDGMINGGFNVLSPDIITLIKDHSSICEQVPLEQLARESQMMAYQHHGFRKPMDTLSDKRYLKELWANSNAPWKSWL